MTPRINMFWPGKRVNEQSQARLITVKMNLYDTHWYKILQAALNSPNILTTGDVKLYEY